MRIYLLLIEISFFVFYPVIWLYFYFKKKDKLNKRFKVNNLSNSDLWFHGASMGEINGLFPIIDEILAENKYKITVSVMTESALEKLQKKYGDKIQSFILPLDLGFLQKKVINSILPKKLIITETELWPNLIFHAKKKGLEIILVNGRISDKKFKIYKKFSFFWKNILNCFSSILVQSEKDYDYFCKIGADENKIKILGNTKYMIKPKQKILINREQFGKYSDYKIVTFGSLHPQELDILAPFFKKKCTHNHYFIIAPRHLNKINFYEKFFRDLGINFIKRSDNVNFDEANIMLLDTMGELNDFYAISDIVFIGGSLIPIGGHNPYEGIMYCKYVLIGEYYNNSEYLVNELKNKSLINIFSSKNSVDELCKIMNCSNEILEERKENIKKYLLTQENNLNSILEIIKR